MSLDTLLEAAEFLESRGEGNDGKMVRLGMERQLSESSSSIDSTYSNIALKSSRPRTKSGSSSSLFDGNSDHFFLRAGTREVHNKLEKNRRAHLKECFDFLKKNIPSLEDRRTSNLGILRTSLRYIQNLKRKEREFELEMQKFAHEKIVLQDRIHSLKSELNKMNIDVDLNMLTVQPDIDNDSNSTSTATERGTPPPSDHDEQDDDEEEAEKLAMETNSPTPKLPLKRKHSKDNILAGIKFPAPKTQAHIMPFNGMITKSSSAPLLSGAKHTPKKVLPVTLGLTGPTQSQQPISVINTINPGPAAFEMSVTGKILEIPPVKTPVTQILHRTLQQRQQALLTQRIVKPSTTAARASSAPLTAAQLKSPPLSQPSPAVSLTTGHVTSQSSASSLIVKDGIPSATKLLTASIAGTNAATVTSMSIPYYMASLQKIAHPVLVTSLMAPAVGLQSTTSMPVSTTTLTTSFASTTSNMSIKSTRVDPVNSITLASNNLRTINNVPTFTIVTSASKLETSAAVTSTVATTSLSSASIPIRPIFTPNLLPGQLAWPFLTIPRSNVLVTTTPATSIAGATVASTSQVTSNPLGSLAQLNQLTQMMTPMTVVSPGMQVTPTALTQAQLNSMFGSPLLKQLPLGIPSSLLQSGQVLGQQVLKPVVVVTVPNVMTQTPTTTLPSNTSLVTSSL
ncbi:hypothetical protein ACF0H5_017092 [Mactra antiquata]